MDTVRKAAVFIPIILKPEPVLLLTKRTKHLTHHAGEISFPGGSYELSDENLLVTALRETEEEINLPKTAIKIIGEIPSRRTLSLPGFDVTAYYGFADLDNISLVLSEEVEDLLYLPITYTLEENHWQQKKIIINSIEKTFWQIDFAEQKIWGLTAYFIRELRAYFVKVLSGIN